MKKGMIYGNMHKFRPSFFMLLKIFFSTLETFFTSPFFFHMLNEITNGKLRFNITLGGISQ